MAEVTPESVLAELRNGTFYDDHDFATEGLRVIRELVIERDRALEEEARSQAEWRRLGAERDIYRAELERIRGQKVISIANPYAGRARDVIRAGDEATR